MAFSSLLPTLVGIAASIFSTISLLPQLVKIIREKKAEDLSLWMLVILLTGLSLWVWYGFLSEDLIIIIANSISVCINLLIIFFSLRYKNR
jgi:MtN3 and saliva related transmembrane protein